ncbi:MAG: hypothetical protein QW609_04020 [Candidatus Aenigmatarchaeota archaeon]
MSSGTVSGTKLTLTKQVQKKKRVKMHEIIYRALERMKACSVSELANHIWYSDENSNFKSLEVFNRYVDRILQQLYAAGKVVRLNFRTEKGRIYGLTIEDCWDYIFRNNLAPEKLIRNFMYLLGSEGFVTNVELKELGFNNYVIEKWIERKLCKEGNYIMMHNASGDNQIKVYFLPRYFGQLEAYLNSSKFREIFSKYCLKRKFGNYIGHYIEDIVAELFEKKGYQVKKRVWIKDLIRDGNKEKEKVIGEVDVFCFNPEDGEIILIECKTTSNIIGIGHLHKLIYLRNIRYKGSGKFFLSLPFDVSKYIEYQDKIYFYRDGYNKIYEFDIPSFTYREITIPFNLFSNLGNALSRIKDTNYLHVWDNSGKKLYKLDLTSNTTILVKNFAGYDFISPGCSDTWFSNDGKILIMCIPDIVNRYYRELWFYNTEDDTLNRLSFAQYPSMVLEDKDTRKFVIVDVPKGYIIFIYDYLRDKVVSVICNYPWYPFYTDGELTITL